VSRDSISRGWVNFRWDKRVTFRWDSSEGVFQAHWYGRYTIYANTTELNRTYQLRVYNQSYIPPWMTYISFLRVGEEIDITVEMYSYIGHVPLQLVDHTVSATGGTVDRYRFHADEPGDQLITLAAQGDVRTMIIRVVEEDAPIDDFVGGMNNRPPIVAWSDQVRNETGVLNAIFWHGVDLDGGQLNISLEHSRDNVSWYTSMTTTTNGSIDLTNSFLAHDHYLRLHYTDHGEDYYIIVRKPQTANGSEPDGAGNEDEDAITPEWTRNLLLVGLGALVLVVVAFVLLIVIRPLVFPKREGLDYDVKDERLK
jgi:hypothetical protein